jgi:hypothetical protein
VCGVHAGPLVLCCIVLCFCTVDIIHFMHSAYQAICSVVSFPWQKQDLQVFKALPCLV